jgi:hypothetical protein
MYVVYLLADAVCEYEIISGRRAPMLSVKLHNESVWIVPGTVNADDSVRPDVKWSIATGRIQDDGYNCLQR